MAIDTSAYEQAKNKTPKASKAQSQQATQTIDRPINDEIKSIYIDTRLATYDACHEARNRGISDGIQQFREELSQSNQDFFDAWSTEAQMTIESRAMNRNALPCFSDSVDIANLDQYPLEQIVERYNWLVARQLEISPIDREEMKALKLWIDASIAHVELSSGE
jgi:hypothetical protein